MKRVFFVILALMLVLVFGGCPKTENNLDQNNVGIESNREETQGEALIEDAGNSSSGNASDEENQGSGDSSGKGLSESNFNKIDWNYDAYSTYFKVVTKEAVINYWDGGETVLMTMPDMIMYMFSGAGESTSIAVDLKSGYITEGYGFASIPQLANAAQPAAQPAPKYQSYNGMQVFSDEDMYVYTFPVEGGTASYYVNKSLVCAGWTYSSDEGQVTYVLEGFSSFEAAVDNAFKEYADGHPGGGEEKYADSDGDGYSDWNEERPPSLEEFETLSERWKDEGLEGTDYFRKAGEVFSQDLDM